MSCSRSANAHCSTRGRIHGLCRHAGLLFACRRPKLFTEAKHRLTGEPTRKADMVDRCAARFCRVDLKLGAMTVRAAVCCEVAQRACQPIGASTMGETSKKSARVGKKAADPASAEPVLLSGGNPQIPKGYGDAPVQAYIAAMPAWKSEVRRRLDAVIECAVPGVRKAVKWNSPFYGRGPRLVSQLSRLRQVHQSGLLLWRLAQSRPAGRVQAEGRALPAHPRGRPARRAPVR